MLPLVAAVSADGFRCGAARLRSTHPTIRSAAMSNAPRILITGFGPFPGAPFNPTQALVRKLATLRRPAFADVTRIAHIFDVTYATVDRELPELIARHRPDALLMFGLAARTPYLRIETRARNAV